MLMDSAGARGELRHGATSGQDDLARTEQQLTELSALLSAVDEQRPTTIVPTTEIDSPLRENQLAMVRLGIAGGLFTALRAKHADTAAHALRVTLGCSAWSLSMGLEPELHDAIEVGSLLHDIGKIGVPDRVLLKPTALSPEEAAIMNRHRRMGLDILRSCCASPLVLEIVDHSTTWYDGRGDRPCGEELPLGARMLSIVDAFDAMTSNKVYRRALSRERAINELFRFAGTQFDPLLVERFSQFNETEQARLQEQVARGWLKSLQPEEVNAYWRFNDPSAGDSSLDLQKLFQQRLLDNMNDAVVFVDTNFQIAYWSRGAERLTGIESSSIHQRPWSPSVLEMTAADGACLPAGECPVAFAIHTGEQFNRRLRVRGRGGRAIPVQVQGMPVIDDHGTTHGATLLLHDVSPQTSLEARCQSLHEMATKDPLTQVANRAEFDRVHEMFVVVHLEQGLPCSLIICDIDNFKQINDTYGHPAGDEVIKRMAKLLKRSCRPGDLVARYGGEEFVLLCAGCDNASAAGRAEELRASFGEMEHEVLGGKRVTASFGVTEIQPGDTPDTMLRRADRALLNAKSRGRNMVVQLGSGIGAPDGLDQAVHGLRDAVSNFAAGAVRPGDDHLLEEILVTTVPLGIAIEKLRGFVADHHAQIIAVNDNHMRLQVGGKSGFLFRRSSDRPIRFVLDMRATEEDVPVNRGDIPGLTRPRTRFHITINPLKHRDRRLGNVMEHAQKVLASLQAYLMATPLETPQMFIADVEAEDG